MPSSQVFPGSLDYAPYFEERIKIEQETIISYKRSMVSLVALGLLIVLAVLLFNQKLGSLTSPIIGIGGVFITSLSAFPYREITPRRCKIASYNLLRRNFEKFNELPLDDQQKLKDLASKAISDNL